MSQPPSRAESLLAVDLGTINTRVVLFTAQEGRYRFLAAADAFTTAAPPFIDINQGVTEALKFLQEETGHRLIDLAGRMILPSRADGAGVDRMVVTASCGVPMRVVLVGLQENISHESAFRLVKSHGCSVVESTGLNDPRSPEQRVDAILKSAPDMIVVTGGTDQGAGRSLGRLLEQVELVLSLFPPSSRPRLLFAGNQALAGVVEKRLSELTEVHLAPNIRPKVEMENLTPARDVLGLIEENHRLRRIPGLAAFTLQAAAPLQSTHTARSRLVRYLSQVYDPSRGVLSVDVGAQAVTLTAAQTGLLAMRVFSSLGMGTGLRNVLAHCSLADILRWVPMELTEGDILEYLWQKSLNPASIPATPEELMIEQAAARQVMAAAMGKFSAGMLGRGRSFEPIIASGAVITGAATPTQSLRILLDGLQPQGITTLILDPNNLAPALGAAAAVDPVLPVQVVESGAFVNLGTVVSPLVRARPGTIILKVHLVLEDGRNTHLDITAGELVRLPIAPGQTARLQCTPLQGTIIDPQFGSGMGNFKVVGGVCGTVIDARGRPLRLPSQTGARIETLRRWGKNLED